ncbi:hypothetical protein B0H13DRAFT_2093024 [Mycena leptocephala]|nr:hypothetical protein B0H13DRAFT_2093024 [Mycena leptocephala]
MDNFTLRGTFMADAPTDKLYLFLFPPQADIVDGRLSVRNPPDTMKHYWTFDASGLDRLTQEAAEAIGPPTAELSVETWGGRWDDRDYVLIHDFHVAKGFDPDSPDAAIAIGYPLINIEKMRKLARRLEWESSMDGSDTEVEDNIYYSHGLC